MQERTSSTERYTRGFAAAVVAVATLILAANAGPARAAEAGCAQNSAVSSSNPSGSGTGTVRPSLYLALLA
ncbi:hypothetical protein ACIBAG_11780 [Streptomyces sp. NPDC051243]|uniref:hypothetical protein n=1 Tax=Streptomyces sp. NPDC051243 TaxID=3365646 RepID=UPI00379FAB96